MINQEPGGAVSNHRLSRRALASVVVLPLFTLVACASSGVKKTVDDSDHPSSIGSNDGKSIEDMLATRFPGVSVSRTDGGGLEIRIRGGSNTFYGSNDPLILVDDTPVQPGTRGVVFLNPYDIEKIEVLKNPADIGVYGVRGSNGVIRISTKRPGRR